LVANFRGVDRDNTECAGRIATEVMLLHKRWPEDLDIRAAYVALFLAGFEAATEDNNIEEMRAMLARLRKAQQDWIEPAVIRHYLAYALVRLVETIALGHTGDREEVTHALGELEALERRWPKDTFVHECRFDGLNRVFEATQDGMTSVALEFAVDTIDSLYLSRPSDERVRATFGCSIAAKLTIAASAKNTSECDLLLHKLRELHQAAPRDESLKESFAKGLVVSMKMAEEAGDNDKCLELNEELLPILLSAVGLWTSSLLLESTQILLRESEKERAEWSTENLVAKVLKIIAPPANSP
jgi:hypothetical protein